MALSPTKITPVLDPNCLDAANAASEVFPPLATTTTLANDVGAGEQKLRNQTHTLNEVKVNRSGDTMTGRLTITPAAATNGLVVSAGPGSNQNAIQATGDGIGPAIIGTGGVNAVGATFAAGGGNNFGVRGTGAGTEPGGEFIGGTTGAGMKARAGTASTAVAPTYAMLAVDGGFHMSGVVSPDATVNPGIDFAQFPQSIVTSSALVTSNVFTVNASGFNVATFAGTAGGIATITFVRPLPGNNYRIHVFAQDGYDARWNGVQNVGNFQFIVRDQATNAVVNLTTTTIVFYVTTVGF